MPLGFYIHIPFCEKRCNYCNFFSTIHNENNENLYINELIEEIKKIKYRYGTLTFNTIYLGGGTPSLLNLYNMERLFNAIYKEFSFINPEITIEANPNSANKIDYYTSFGINRLSLGVQSTNDKYLQILGRLHSSQEAIKTLEKANKYFDNISADLIIGIDNKQEPINELKQIANLITHLSCYILTLEEKTPLYNMIASKMVSMATEDELIAQYEGLVSYANSIGFIQYETSNFAKNNKISKHNSSYWDLSPYIGIGAGAHSYYEGKRYFNVENLSLYINGVHSGNNKEIIEREKNFSEDKYEYVMLSLRTVRGIVLSDYNNKFSTNFLSDYEQGVLKAKKYLLINDESVSIIPKYFLVQNEIIRTVLQV